MYYKKSKSSCNSYSKWKEQHLTDRLCNTGKNFQSMLKLCVCVCVCVCVCTSKDKNERQRKKHLKSCGDEDALTWEDGVVQEEHQSAGCLINLILQFVHCHILRLQINRTLMSTSHPSVCTLSHPPTAN